MEFRLLYSGYLLGASRNDTRASLKHEVRLELHPQLKRLWETKNGLIRWSAEHAGLWSQRHPDDIVRRRPNVKPGSSMDEYRWTAAELKEMGINYLAEQYTRSGHRFLPLITEQSGMYCSLEILFLRPEEPSMLLKGGDLDNRIKTLFDALRVPQTLEECGGIEGKPEDPPIYCLLSDDKLVSDLHVTCDHLLMLPHEQTIGPNHVFLVVKVALTPRYGTRLAYYYD